MDLFLHVEKNNYTLCAAAHIAQHTQTGVDFKNFILPTLIFGLYSFRASDL